jgi:hypothetical protein
MAFVRNQNKKNVIIEKQDTNINQSSKKFQESKNTQFQPQFTKSEAIWMMGLIKNHTFKGEEVQKVYEAVVKLQLIVNESNFPFTGDALITGSLIVSQSYTVGDTDSTALRLLGSGSVSQSGIFEVEGSAGPLFSVADGLDGVLMEVNNISGLPLFQVSSLNRGNLTSGVTTATASFANFSGSFLSVESSGSTVFEVIGSEGTLFSVDDDLDGTIFTANDRTGLPVLEASASGEVYIGKSPQSLYTTAVISSNNANVTQSIYGLDTSSYGGAFFDYTAHSGSNARAGSIMSVWNGSSH